MSLATRTLDLATRVGAEMKVVRAATAAATATARGTVRISGTPADPAAPVAYVREQVDVLLGGKASTAHAATHASGGSDAVTLAQAQVTNLTTDLATKAARTFASPLAFQLGDAATALATTEPVQELYVPYGLTLTGWALTADAAGSVVLVIGVATYANYPTVTEVFSGARPTLSTAQKNRNEAAGSVAVAAGSVVRITVSSASTVKRVSLSLLGARA